MRVGSRSAAVSGFCGTPAMRPIIENDRIVIAMPMAKRGCRIGWKKRLNQLRWLATAARSSAACVW